MASAAAARAANRIEADLRAGADGERAANEKRYLKSELEFIGVPVPEMRRAARTYLKQHPEISHDELVDLVEALWSKPVHERRSVAVWLLELRGELLGPRDLKLIERLVRESRTWALVDPLAGVVLGGIVGRYPKSGPRLDRWARDPDFWVRRAALLASLAAAKREPSLRRFYDYADAMLEEKEFFIRKAIGWVLRERSKTRPDEVYDWLAPRCDRTSGVTMREAVKYLDPPRRDELMRAYKEKRAL